MCGNSLSYLCSAQMSYVCQLLSLCRSKCMLASGKWTDYAMLILLTTLKGVSHLYCLYFHLLAVTNANTNRANTLILANIVKVISLVIH